MEANRNPGPDRPRTPFPRSTVPLQAHRFADPLLDPRAEDLRLAGRVVGQVVTLGERLQLFTTLPSLAALDGQVFPDREALAAAVREALPAPPSGVAAAARHHSPAASEIRAMPGVSVTMRRVLRSSK